MVDYFKKIDDEITFHHQAIARHQVDIARLETARSVISGLQHERGEAPGADAAINGHKGPLLTVRKKQIAAPPPTPMATPKRGKRQGRAKDGSRIEDHVLRVLAEVAEPIDSKEVRKRLPDVGKTSIWAVLNTLKQRGVIQWDDHRRYSIAQSQ
jgi:hypothetical protein